MFRKRSASTKGYEYARVSNPTRDRLETNLAALEGGVASRVFASGMAAINAICTMMKAGDHLVCRPQSLWRRAAPVQSGPDQFWTGIHLRRYLRPAATSKKRHPARTRACVYVETPTNPLMALSDIARHQRDLRTARSVEVVVDNTFMSPYFQRPIALGADMVVHSTTKFLNGHSDGLGGVVVCTKPEQADKLAFLQKCCGRDHVAV